MKKLDKSYSDSCGSLSLSSSQIRRRCSTCAHTDFRPSRSKFEKRANSFCSSPSSPYRSSIISGYKLSCTVGSSVSRGEHFLWSVFPCCQRRTPELNLHFDIIFIFFWCFCCHYSIFFLDILPFFLSRLIVDHLRWKRLSHACPVGCQVRFQSHLVEAARSAL